ncbi:MAG: PorP/SprF family type IX secretion system membrane protein [Salinivirgaceae bacterium]|nr:PorP/SprF family type IX secretion system membrane protein [Salinivirgaceae bacterium]
MNRLLVTIFLSVVFCGLFAQNDNYSSLNMFNHMYYNPGYAGDGNEIEAKGLNRNQWMGMPGTPNAFTFSIDMPFKLFGQHHGAGISIITDQIGYFSNTGLNISYAYRKSFMQGDLGIGAGLNMINQSLDGTFITSSGGDGSSDAAIPAGASNKPLALDLNLGLFYKSDNLFLSISGRNLFSSNLKYINAEGTEATGDAVFSYGTQFFISTGYDYQLANPLFSLQPGIFIASDFASTQWSASGILTYNKRFFGGLAYKPTDAISILAGVDLPSGIEVAVAYDFTTSRIINASKGSFEFMVGYSFSLDIDKDNRKYKSVRFL